MDGGSQRYFAIKIVRVRLWLGSYFLFCYRVTGPALEIPCVVTAVAPLRIWLGHGCDVARSRRQWMGLVALAALRNVLRVMRHIAVWTLLVTVWPQIVSRRRDEFIERSMTPQASVL